MNLSHWRNESVRYSISFHYITVQKVCKHFFFWRRHFLHKKKSCVYRAINIFLMSDATAKRIVACESHGTKRYDMILSIYSDATIINIVTSESALTLYSFTSSKVYRQFFCFLLNHPSRFLASAYKESFNTELYLFFS